MITRRLVLAGSAASLIGCSGGGGGAPPPPAPVQLAPAGNVDLTGRPWVFQFGSASPPFRTGLTFDIPSAGDIHYLVCPVNFNASQKTAFSLTIGIKISSPVVFVPSDPGETAPCHFSLMLQCIGDNLSTDGFRWFSHKFNLDDGIQNISVPLTFANWTGIYGEPATASNGFSTTLNNLANVAITFGGNSFAGHGIRVAAGAASFSIVQAILG